MKRSVPSRPAERRRRSMISGLRRRAWPSTLARPPAAARSRPASARSARNALEQHGVALADHRAEAPGSRLTSFGMQRSLHRPYAKASLSSIGSPCLLGRDLDGKHHLVVVADRRAVGVGDAMRRRIEHLGLFQILGAGPVEARRHAGIAGVPPIGLPARIHAELNAGDQRSACRRCRRCPTRAAPSNRSTRPKAIRSRLAARPMLGGSNAQQCASDEAKRGAHEANGKGQMQACLSE